MKRLLTPEQRLLFKFQRVRLQAQSESDGSDKSSDESAEEASRDPKKVKHLLNRLKGFEPKSQLDRDLLLGLLLRDVSKATPKHAERRNLTENNDQQQLRAPDFYSY